MNASFAPAQELDTLLPPGVPGYGKPFGVRLNQQLKQLDASGVQLEGFSLVPQLSASGGYDTAPNGAAGSAVIGATPSLLAADPILGFGAYAAAEFANYLENTPQNTSGVTLATGERVALSNETITLSAGYIRTEETGFALDTVSRVRPLAFTVQDLRATDEISLGLFELTPEASATIYRFPGLVSQNRTDTREALTGSFLSGGPLKILLRVQATQSNYREDSFDADTDQLLFGFMDTANGLWTVSALAGGAERQPRTGKDLDAPVLEAGLDWAPTDFDQLRVTLAREIDNPDEISANAYTLSEAKLSADHVFPSQLSLKWVASVSNAAFFNSALRETLIASDATLTMPLGADFAVTGDYTFNDRQANMLRAANDNVFTLGAVWTP